MSRFEPSLSLLRGPRRISVVSMALVAALAVSAPVAARGPSAVAPLGTSAACGLTIGAASSVPAAAGTRAASPLAAATATVVGPAAGSLTLVRDIDPSGSSNPTGLATFQGHVAFSARDDVHGRELWITTASSAKRLGDIAPGAASSTPRDLTAVGSILYFTANDGVHGRELWRTDGTAGGTRMVRDIRPGSRGSAPGGLIRFDGRLFLAANDGVHGSELYKSDGTRAGTRLVKDLEPGGGSAVIGDSRISGNDWVVMGGRLYFTAYRDSGELWRTDGTAGGTARVKAKLLIDGSLVATSQRLYFMGSPDLGGCALPGPFFYTSDGTGAGTHQLDAPDPMGSIVTLNGKAFFGANGFSPFRRLFRSGGTDTSTVMVKPKVGLDDDTDIVRSNGWIFVSQKGALAITNGTGTGTHVLGESSLGWRASVDVAALGDTWYFPAGTGSERELWQSDGSEAGTVPVGDLNPGGNAGVRSLVATGGSVWFTATDGTHGRELYRYEP